jgi:hypothetical protein
VGRSVYRGGGRPAYVLLTGGAVAALTAVLVATGRADFPAQDRFLIFAFGLLPLVNAVFDLLSYGLTLTLLRRGWFGRPEPTARLLWLGLIDAVAAVVILIGLGLTLTLIVAGINALSEVPLFDLRQVFDDLADPVRRDAYAWLIVALLTTLVPTLFHLGVLLFTAFAWIPAQWRAGVAGLATPDGPALRQLAFLSAGTALGLGYCAVVAAGLTGIGWFVTGHLGTLGDWLLLCVETLAVAVGALQPWYVPLGPSVLSP